MSLAHKLHRLKRLPLSTIPAVIAFKVKTRLKQSLERVRYRSTGPRLQAAVKQIRPLGLIPESVHTTEFRDFFISHYKEDHQQIIRDADAAVNLVFDLLGSGPVNLKEFTGAGRIPWEYDFKSGEKWDPSIFYADIRYGDKEGVDVKVPWELSRCQHFVTLGQAYLLSGNDVYAQTFFDQLDDWINSNPVKRGVNWACAMDVALRASNWLLAWDFFRHTARAKEMEAKLASSLWEHGDHIYRHLEWGGAVSSNHYLADLLGLAYIGLALSEPEWLSTAVREFEKEILAQTYDDGMDYEGSTAYHRLVLEMFFYFALALSRAGESKINLSQPFARRLRSMFLFLIPMLNQAGRMPLIGDNDSGRVHVFRNRADNDTGYLASLGAVFFLEGLMKIGERMTSEPLWLFGAGSFDRYQKLQADDAASKEKAPEGSGLVVMRGADDHLVFVAQPNGTRGVGNHTHNDKLSFVLSVRGDEFFVDAGTAAYTAFPDLRNRFRSTSAHNTVEIDGEEQNRFMPDSLFTLYDDAAVTVEQWVPNEKITAHHTGYKRLRGDVIHRRSVERTKNGTAWTIEDKVEGSHKHHVAWTFLAGPEIVVTQAVPGSLKFKGANGELTLTSENASLSLVIAEGKYAPHYGDMVKTTIVKFFGELDLPHQNRFRLSWIPRPG